MALIKNIEDFKKFVPGTAKAIPYDKISSFIELAEIEVVKKLLGDTFYDGLNDRYNTEPSALTNNEKKLMPYIQRGIANMAFWYWIPYGNITVSSGGELGVFESATLKPASAFKVKQISNAALNIAHKSFELLIDYLVKNKSLYSDYASSNAYAEAKDSFINSATEFTNFFSIRNNRWIYWNIKPIMTRLEEDLIKPRTGESLFDELKNQIKLDNVTDENKAILRFIKYAVANMTIAESILELGLNIDQYGLTVNTSGTTNSQEVDLKNPAPALNQGILRDKCERVGLQKLKELDNYLRENHSDYPGYEAEVYQEDDDADITNDINNPFYQT